MCIIMPLRDGVMNETRSDHHQPIRVDWPRDLCGRHLFLHAITSAESHEWCLTYHKGARAELPMWRTERTERKKWCACVADHPSAEEFEAAREKVRLGFQVYRPPPQLGQPSSLEQVQVRDSTAWQPYSLATVHLVLMNVLVDMA